MLIFVYLILTRKFFHADTHTHTHQAETCTCLSRSRHTQTCRRCSRFHTGNTTCFGGNRVPGEKKKTPQIHTIKTESASTSPSGMNSKQRVKQGKTHDAPLRHDPLAIREGRLLEGESNEGGTTFRPQQRRSPA